MNISNHCFERYHERVREQNSPFVDSLKTKYQEEIETLYEHCEKIYSGIIGHSTRPVDVYINQHGWVLITNDKEKTIITLYKVGLGIDDEDLDKKYIKTSLKKIKELQEELLNSSLKNDEEIKNYKEKIEANNVLIKEYSNEIDKLRNQNEDYKDLIKSLDSVPYKAQIKLRDAIENYMVKDTIKIELDVK